MGVMTDAERAEWQSIGHDLGLALQAMAEYMADQGIWSEGNLRATLNATLAALMPKLEKAAEAVIRENDEARDG